MPVSQDRLSGGTEARKATKKAKTFNVTVNAYDPVVHVYNGGAAVVNSPAKRALPASSAVF